MKKILLSSLVASTVLLGSEYKYEVSPMVGYIDTQHKVDLKNHSVVGLGAYRNMDEDCMLDQLELALFRATGVDYENSSLETSISLFSINGIKEYKLNDTFNLYALAGIGYERIQDEHFGNESDPFANYGVGIKAKLTELVSLKLDARHLLKFDGDQNILYTAGLSFAFGDKAPKTIKQETKPQPIIEKETPKETIAKAVEEKVEKVQEPKDEQVVVIKPIDLEVLFDFDSAKIKSYSIEKFEKFVEYYKTIENCKIIIEGHTDSVGREKYNKGLSHRRALSAKKQLIKMGVPEESIITKGYGEAKPKVPNTTEENRQLNRRIEGSVIQ